MTTKEVPTVTWYLQRRVEERAVELYGRVLRASGGDCPTPPTALAPPPLATDAHARFLRAALGPLPPSFASLDASRCWIVFWALHGLALLGRDLEEEGSEMEEEDEEEKGEDDEEEGDDGTTTTTTRQRSTRPHRIARPRGARRPKEQQQQRQPRKPPSPCAVAHFLASCQAPSGGFGGGPGQRPHLAPTYAAVAALVTLNTREAWRVVDRPALRAFLLRCADEARARGGRGGGGGGGGGDGQTTAPVAPGWGFAMHEGGGEVDARSCYTALAAADLAGLDVLELAHRSRALDFLSACQTYEGGCGGEPGNEAHGGYTYCAAAAAAIIRRAAERARDRETAIKAARAVEPRSALRWASRRQAWVEGGFSGRANKLADGCYSFWVGALFPILRDQVAWMRREEEGGGGGNGGAGSNPPQPPPLASDLLAVPPLPRSVLQGRAEPPVEAARRASLVARQRAGDATSALLRAAARAGGEVKPEEDADDKEDQQHVALLDRATRAQADEARAATDVAVAECSAAMLSGAAAAAAPPAPPPPPQASCNARALALWVLLACQPAALEAAEAANANAAPPSTTTMTGGLRDKPGKPPDFYHTCYCLSALALLQEEEDAEVQDMPRTDPLLNVVAARAEAARAFFFAAEEGEGDEEMGSGGV